MLKDITEKIIHPTVLLDKKKCFANIERMVKKANKYNLALRPHFKTHQSAEIGKWFMDLGVEEITVSSIEMAVYFAKNGWKKIIIAFPVNIRAMHQLNELATQCQLTVLVTNARSMAALIEGIKTPLSFFIEIDTGYGRTGIKPEDLSQISEFINQSKSNNKLKFRGFYVHNGHTYKANSQEEINEIHIGSIRKLKKLKETFQESFPTIEVQMGDTPSCSTMEHFEYIDAIGPGNFVFYDLVQTGIGSCEVTDIAVAIACPVVDKYPDNCEIIIHGGGVHFSKDKLEEESRAIYGKVVKMDELTWSEPISNVYVSALSQEHGTIKADREFFNAISIGDVVYVLPVHACLATNLHTHYLTLEGEKIARLH